MQHAEGRSRDMERHLIDLDHEIYTRSDWKVLPSDQIPSRARGVLEFDPARIRLHFDQRQLSGQHLFAREVYETLHDVCVLPPRMIEFYLANPHLIRKEWNGLEIPFWGVIFTDHLGYKFVRFMHQATQGWRWCIRRLDGMRLDTYNPTLCMA